MIFKVNYQETKEQAPLRETTKALYLEADNLVEAREMLEKTPYNIEFIREISGDYLEYEKTHNPDFEVVSF